MGQCRQKMVGRLSVHDVAPHRPLLHGQVDFPAVVRMCCQRSNASGTRRLIKT